MLTNQKNVKRFYGNPTLQQNHKTTKNCCYIQRQLRKQMNIELNCRKYRVSIIHQGFRLLTTF